MFVVAKFAKIKINNKKRRTEMKRINCWGDWKIKEINQKKCLVILLTSLYPQSVYKHRESL